MGNFSNSLCSNMKNFLSISALFINSTKGAEKRQTALSLFPSPLAGVLAARAQRPRTSWGVCVDVSVRGGFIGGAFVCPQKNIRLQSGCFRSYQKKIYFTFGLMAFFTSVPIGVGMPCALIHTSVVLPLVQRRPSWFVIVFSNIILMSDTSKIFVSTSITSA